MIIFPVETVEPAKHFTGLTTTDVGADKPQIKDGYAGVQIDGAAIGSWTSTCKRFYVENDASCIKRSIYFAFNLLS